MCNVVKLVVNEPSEVVQRFRDTEIIVIHDAFGLYEAVCETPGVKAGYYGFDDQFCCSYGTLDQIREKLGLDTKGIRDFLQKKIGVQ